MELSEEHSFVFTIQFYLDACLPHSSLQHGETTYLELYQVQFQKLHDTLRLLLLPSRFSHIRLCATPQMAAHQAPPSLGFFRQEHWSALPFPSLIHESEKWKWSRSVVSDSSHPMDSSLPGSSIHGIFQARVLEWGAFSNLKTKRAQCAWWESKDHYSFLSFLVWSSFNSLSSMCTASHPILLY